MHFVSMSMVTRLRAVGEEALRPDFCDVTSKGTQAQLVLAIVRLIAWCSVPGPGPAPNPVCWATPLTYRCDQYSIGRFPRGARRTGMPLVSE